MRKRVGDGERRGGGIFSAATAPSAKSRASYFRFARLYVSTILSESLAQATNIAWRMSQ